MGVSVEAPPVPLTVDNFVTNSFQTRLKASVASNFPIVSDAIRFHNQIIYSLGLSPSQHILIGRDDYLLNPIYTKNYCKRDAEKSAAKMDAWAKMLRQIQDIIVARGQVFVYVLTPSKIEHRPGSLPLGYPCPSPDRDRFLLFATDRLARAGVIYIDATADLDESRDRYGYDPFPQGGIHWTDLAAHSPTMRIMETVNKQKGRTVLYPYDVRVEGERWPVADEVDYASLLNLVWEPSLKRTAMTAIATSAARECPAPISIIAVGGSFFTSLGKNLTAGPCPPIVNQLRYLVIDTMRFANNAFTLETEPKYDLTRSADVVILEENAGVLLETSHIPALHKYLHTGELPPQTLY